VGWTLKSLGLDGLILIGLAKSRTERDFKSQDITSSYERIVVPKRDKNNSLEPGAQPNTILLKQGSPAFRLLTQLRDEAHRFAISFHRDRRDKSSVKSVLSEVKGLGTKRKKKLIESYPDMNDLLKEDAKSISEKTGIPLNVILELKDKMSILQA
jgi:excinuclease ABC subunit C